MHKFMGRVTGSWREENPALSNSTASGTSSGSNNNHNCNQDSEHVTGNPVSALMTEEAKPFVVAGELTISQKRGFAGLCACLLPRVKDGSSGCQWSTTYLQLVVELFLGLPADQVHAFLPMLESAIHRSDSDEKPAKMELLDPAPFLALVVPASTSGSIWSKLGKKHRDQKKMKKYLANSVSSNTSSASSSSSSKSAYEQELNQESDHTSASELHLYLLKKLLWFTVKTIGYDARARTLLRAMTVEMQVPWLAITVEEVVIGRSLYAEATSMPMEKAVAKVNLRDWKRNATIGAAAVTGGALLALTGGLAAPAIAASLTALGGAGIAVGTVVGSAAGVTATTVLFGTAGVGIVGMKTDARTRGVEEFTFDLVSAGDGMNVYICISGWLDEDDPPHMQGFRRSWGDSREYLRAFYRRMNDKKVDHVNQMLERYKGREDEFFAILRETYSIKYGTLEHDPLGLTGTSRDAAVAPTSSSSLSKRDRKKSKAEQEKISASAAQREELMRAWRWKDRFPLGDQYCLNWEESTLRKFGTSMRSFATDQAIKYANGEIVKYTALAALFAAVAIPRTILSAADMIDNVWVLMMNRADQSGKLLADTLRRREQGLRPVTLVGYGMGARLIFSCLKQLATFGDECCGIVENVVLLGTPVPVVVEEWKNARRVVSGRLINGYSDNDWMLAVMYRYQGWALNSAGIGPVDIPGVSVENANFSSIVNGHMEYKNKIGAILDMLKLEG